jgi:hypothetical protein
MPRFAFGINRFDTKWVGEWPNRQRIYVPPEQTGLVSWDEYVELLCAHSAIARLPAAKDRTCPWTAPFILGSEGEGRRMDNIVGVSSFASFDLDQPGWSFERLTRKLRALRYILCTTTNSRRHPNQRWRITIELDRELTAAEYGAVWAFVNDGLDRALDQKTHNANRILFVPARWVDADNIFHVRDGEPLSVDAILAAGYQPFEIETFQPIEVIGSRERPDGRTIITENMERKFASSAPGGRFWTLICQSAIWHAENAWQLGDHELCAAAMSVSQTYAPGVRRQSPLREAQRALAWAENTAVPKSALERLHDRQRHYFSKKEIKSYGIIERW